MSKSFPARYYLFCPFPMARINSKGNSVIRSIVSPWCRQKGQEIMFITWDSLIRRPKSRFTTTYLLLCNEQRDKDFLIYFYSFRKGETAS